MASIEVRGEVLRPGLVEAASARIAPLLEQAEPGETATHATVVADDGYRASIPLAALRDGGELSVEDDSLRLRVIDGKTLCWNVKNVVAIDVSVGKQPDDVPPKPKH